MPNNSTFDKRTDREANHERKLQKSNDALRAAASKITSAPGTWEVSVNKELGTHFVLILGGSKFGNAQKLIIHRMIGTDYRIDQHDDWIISSANDLANFLSDREDPGIEKVRKTLSLLKSASAIRSGKVYVEDEVEKYLDGSDRKAALDLAREAHTAHKSSNSAGCWSDPLLYMKPEHAFAEVYMEDFRVHRDPKYLMDKVSSLLDSAHFQTKLLDGKVQKVVEHLYGVPENMVLKAIYQKITGGEPVIGLNRGEYDLSFGLPFTRHLNYVRGDEEMRKDLVRELKVYADARKAYNISKSEKDKEKDLSLQKPLVEETEKLKLKMGEISSKIDDIVKGSTAPKISKIPWGEFILNPQIGPKESREMLRDPKEMKARLSALALSEFGKQKLYSAKPKDAVGKDPQPADAESSDSQPAPGNGEGSSSNPDDP